MTKLILGNIFSFIMGFVCPTFLPILNLANKEDTLYAVCGIMFSIGMSLIVTTTFSKIKNYDTRNKFKREYRLVRNYYIIQFLLVSVLYMLLPKSDELISLGEVCQFSLATFISFDILYSIIFFIVNFIALQNLNSKLDEEISK